jgi:hypothetical protein
MDPGFITLEDCVIAYRKAKTEAYYENSHLQAPAFAEYERSLLGNLRQLVRMLRSDSLAWTEDQAWIGSYFYTPKSVSLPEEENADGLFYRCLDPLEEWRRIFSAAGDVRSTASFRLMMRPSVNFQVFSALWILKVGHLLDAAVAPDLSYGNRLRRQPLSVEWHYPGTQRGGLNLDCPGLFKPYFSAYRQWREKGLAVMGAALRDGQRVVAITMDISKFYRQISLSTQTVLCRSVFLLRKSCPTCFWLSSIVISLSA